MYTASDHTFVVCAYKENPFLEGTIRSLLDQHVLGNILVSTSTPNDHIASLAAKYDLPMVVNPTPGHIADDWNFGYDQAETALVTIAHQDDLYDPDYLECVLAALNGYDADDVLIAFTNYYEIRNEKRVYRNKLLDIKRFMNVPLRFRALNGSKLVKRRALSFGDPICCPSVTFVKELCGSSVFDPEYENSCDYKTFVDLASKNGRFLYVPKPLMGHRIYAESTTTFNLAENIRQREDAEILNSLWPRPIACLIYRFYAMSEKSNEL